MPERNTIIVANHAQLNGPIIAELFMPDNCFIWANGQMFSAKDVPDYAMADFFPFKSRWMRPIYRLASYLLAPIMPCMMENSRAIPVYRDARIVSTFRTTIRLLNEGKSILIFPECHKKLNNIINEMQENFVDAAKLYYKRTGIELDFLPMYIAPDMNKVFIGHAIKFDSSRDISKERHRIVSYLAESITEMGRSLPEHTVIPFDNISRNEYISNKSFDLLPGNK